MLLIPGLMAALIGAHLYLVTKLGISAPPWLKAEDRARGRRPRPRSASRDARMNQAEKEAYLREYSILKNEGKPFFPYAVAKDARHGVIVMVGDHLPVADVRRRARAKADPTTTTYVPRPDWYFFFLFEVLRVMRNVPKFTPMATIGVPTICMILLFLLPFYDRSPERRIERRPIALAAGMATIAAMAYLTYIGRQHRLAELGRHGAAAPSLTAAQSSRRSTPGEQVVGAVGLPGLPCDRRQRQQRARAAADPHRPTLPPGGDRLDAAQPDRADAVVQGPASRPQKFNEPGQLPLRAAVGRAAGPWRRAHRAAGDRARPCRRDARRARRSGRCSTGSRACTTG